MTFFLKLIITVLGITFIIDKTINSDKKTFILKTNPEFYAILITIFIIWIMI